MLRRTLLTLGLICAIISPALAEEQAAAQDKTLCNKRTEVMKNLAENYSENTVGIGMSSNGGVLEILTSKDGKTWTALLTTPDGKSCLVAMGNAWESLKLASTGPIS